MLENAIETLEMNVNKISSNIFDKMNENEVRRLRVKLSSIGQSHWTRSNSDERCWIGATQFYRVVDPNLWISSTEIWMKKKRRL